MKTTNFSDDLDKKEKKPIHRELILERASNSLILVPSDIAFDFVPSDISFKDGINNAIDDILVIKKTEHHLEYKTDYNTKETGNVVLELITYLPIDAVPELDKPFYRRGSGEYKMLLDEFEKVKKGEIPRAKVSRHISGEEDDYTFAYAVSKYNRYENKTNNYDDIWAYFLFKGTVLTDFVRKNYTLHDLCATRSKNSKTGKEWYGISILITVDEAKELCYNKDSIYLDDIRNSENYKKPSKIASKHMNWQKRDIDTNKEAELIKLGQDKLTARLLSQRSIPLNDVPKFVSSSYNDLSEPHKLKGVKEAADLFCKVALKKGNIGVIGDFDADGIISSTMLREVCNIFGLQCKVFLPSRVTHGYGLNHKSIESIKTKFVTPPELLFIADCGSSNEQEVKELKEWGIKHIIILDHHLIDSSKISKSADVLVNWHLCDFEDTCACGEVFHFIRGIRWLTKKINPVEFLSYAAIGILADVSPIIGDNRIIVKNGLKDYSLNNVTASGLNALIRKANIKGQLSQEDVLFKIAPRINAVGRLDKPDIAHKLLIEQDPTLSDLMAQELNDHNDKRKKMQRTMEKEAVITIEKDIDSYKHGIAIYNPHWPIGIVGLIASRLAEKFCKPTIVMTKNGDIIKGSGRSFADVNLKEVLDDCKDCFDGYGGHKGACGVTLKPHALNDINASFNKACEKYYSVHGKPTETRFYDVEVKPKWITLDTAKKLADSMYPYCNQNNPEPVFLLADATIVEPSLYQKDDWKILSFYASKDDQTTTVKMKMFTDDLGTEIEGMKADIYFTFPQIANAQYPSINVLDFILKKSS